MEPSRTVCHVFFSLEHFRGRVTDGPAESLEELVALVFSREAEIAELDLFRVSKGIPFSKAEVRTFSCLSRRMFSSFKSRCTQLFI